MRKRNISWLQFIVCSLSKIDIIQMDWKLWNSGLTSDDFVLRQFNDHTILFFFSFTCIRSRIEHSIDVKWFKWSISFWFEVHHFSSYVILNISFFFLLNRISPLNRNALFIINFLFDLQFNFSNRRNDCNADQRTEPLSIFYFSYRRWTDHSRMCFF